MRVLCDQNRISAAHGPTMAMHCGVTLWQGCRHQHRAQHVLDGAPDLLRGEVEVLAQDPPGSRVAGDHHLRLPALLGLLVISGGQVLLERRAAPREVELPARSRPIRRRPPHSLPDAIWRVLVFVCNGVHTTDEGASTWAGRPVPSGAAVESALRHHLAVLYTRIQHCR